MARPSPPTAIFVDGHADAGAPIITKHVSGSLPISAQVDDPDAGQKVRLVVRWSTDKNFSSYKTRYSGWHSQGTRPVVYMSGLSLNTLYYGRCYTQDTRFNWSLHSNAFQFWTDRYMDPPLIISPADNTTVDPNVTNLFDWTAHDPDETVTVVDGNQVQYRVAGTALTPPGPWSLKGIGGAPTSWTTPVKTFLPRTTYEWRVRTRDTQRVWGLWSPPVSFDTLGANKTPRLLTPGGDIALAVDEDSVFAWQFQDPDPTATQAAADLRYRAVGSPTWITIAGVETTAQVHTFVAGTFPPGYRHEWQVKTYRDSGAEPDSEWSTSNYFWTILTPGSLADLGDLIAGESIAGQLGCGDDYHVIVTDRGGVIHRGEITKYTTLKWDRRRDNISQASISIKGYDSELGQLLGKMRSWINEIVIFRNGQEVWCGPVVQRTMRKGQIDIAAWDVMAYLYRRILRQGYSDAYRVANGVQIGIKTVVERAGLITVNALSYADPNVLPYLTLIHTGDDAKESRVIPDYTKTVWQDLDDMAQNAGLDYTTLGRRIVYWDTHSFLGMLSEVRDGDFSDPPVVTEYGMQLGNYFAVTDGQGTWGAAYPDGLDSSNFADTYGPIEHLASGYGETASTSVVGQVLTPAQLAALQDQLTSQAKRNISGRYPAPLVARVPDGSSLVPTVNITINQLCPGVWIPLRVDDTVQPFAQVQKLDVLTVNVDAEKGETVGVTLSPAPLGSQDPDGSSADDGGVEGGDVV